MTKEQYKIAHRAARILEHFSEEPDPKKDLQHKVEWALRSARKQGVTPRVVLVRQDLHQKALGTMGMHAGVPDMVVDGLPVYVPIHAGELDGKKIVIK